MITGELKNKIDALFNTVKKLENNNNELNNKTSNIITIVSDLSSMYNNLSKNVQNKISQESNKYNKTNYIKTQIPNIEYNIDNNTKNNKMLYYNKTSPNMLNKNNNILNNKNFF